MLFCITTAGFNKAGPCYSILRDQSIKQLREVISDESHYSLICEPDANDSWEDESTWKKANPMISDVDTILPYLTDRFTRAKNAGGTKEIDFKTKNLNQWTDAPETWLQDSVWMEGNGAPKNMGQKFFAGIDLAHVADMSALVFIGEEDDGGVMDIFTDVWIPGESILEKMKEDKNSQYVNWIKEGFLNHIEQRVTDDREIEERFFLRAKEMDVVSLGYDPKFASGFVSRLSERGVDCWEVPQSYAQMTEAIAFLEQKAIDGKLRHGGHPVLSWHCRNTILRRNRGGEMILDKSEAHRKIDCMVALTLAMKQYQTWKKEAEANVEIFFV